MRDREHASEIKTAIEALGSVALPVKTAGDSGKLFGSVTAGDVVSAIKKAGGPNLDKRIVRLPKSHIKSVGTHPVVVHLHPEIDVELSLDVVANLTGTTSPSGGGHRAALPDRPAALQVAVRLVCAQGGYLARWRTHCRSVRRYPRNRPLTS